MAVGFSHFSLIILAVGVLVPLALVLLLVLLLKGRGQSQPSREEQIQFDQMAAMLRKMEDRITNLETILMHRTPPNVPNDDPMGKV